MVLGGRNRGHDCDEPSLQQLQLCWACPTCIYNRDSAVLGGRSRGHDRNDPALQRLQFSRHKWLSEFLK